MIWFDRIAVPETPIIGRLTSNSQKSRTGYGKFSWLKGDRIWFLGKPHASSTWRPEIWAKPHDLTLMWEIFHHLQLKNPAILRIHHRWFDWMNEKLTHLRIRNASAHIKGKFPHIIYCLRASTSQKLCDLSHTCPYIELWGEQTHSIKSRIYSSDDPYKMVVWWDGMAGKCGVSWAISGLMGDIARKYGGYII